MSKLRSKDPGGFFISALIPCPMDEIQQLAGTMSVVNLGVKDFGDLKFQFIKCLAGAGVEHNWESYSELLVPTLKCEKLGVQHRDCPEVGE